jgi:predicted negative regulator of RcsB-dependent stress response
VRAETRHQLKQDAFSRVTLQAAGKTADWTVEHRTTLIIISIIVVVVLGIGIGGWFYLSSQNEKASFQLAEAVRTMDTQLRPTGTPPEPGFPTFASDKERAETARKQLQTIVDQYPHTRTADMARYFLGTTAADIGDNATAEKNLKEASSSWNRDVASLAKLALASLYGNTNRTKEAVALYQQLINKPTALVSKVTAQLQLAELYESAKQPVEAKRIYEQIKKEGPATEAAQLATQKLTDLK